MARKNKNKTAEVTLIAEKDTQVIENTPITVFKTKKVTEPAVKVGFNTWFSLKQANSTTRSWQRLEILTFFKKQGLEDKETLNTYESVFRNF